MSEELRAICELIERGDWDGLTLAEMALLHRYCVDLGPHDLYLLGSELRRRAQRGRKSSSQTLEAIQQQAEDIRERETLPPEGEE